MVVIVKQISKILVLLLLINLTIGFNFQSDTSWILDDIKGGVVSLINRTQHLTQHDLPVL